MKEQLISFETAKLAKEKGFDVETYKGYLSETIVEYFDTYPSNYIRLSEKYSNSALKNDWLCTAPTQSLLAKWLREEHHLIVIVAYQYEYDSTPYSYWIYKENNSLPLNQWINDLNTYEEALEIGLQEALKLI